MLNTIITWIQENPEMTAAIAVYIVANFAPRPHPDDLTGWPKSFWKLIDWLCVLTADRLPGKFKMLITDSPPKGERGKATKGEAVKDDDADADDAPPDKDKGDDKA